MFDRFPKSECRIVAPDGWVRSVAPGLFSGTEIIFTDVNIQILPGDEIRRDLPNGPEDVYEVVDPKFRQKFSSIEAHYAVKVKRVKPISTDDGARYQVTVSGENSRVNIGSTDNSANVVSRGDLFADIGSALQNNVQDPAQRDALLAATERMKNTVRTPDFGDAYQKFISLAADHMGLIGPFIPALSKFFGA